MTHHYFWYSGAYYLQIKGVAMVSMFALSMANLFMSKWEEDMVLHDKRLELVMWKRFINILLIWNSDIQSAHSFLSHLNNINRGIILSHEINLTAIHFLDLRISIQEKRIVTSTFFKPTDRNGNIPLDSCHHHSWLSAVPKGQFLRLKTKLYQFR